MIVLLFLCVSWARGDRLVRPPPPDRTASECPESYPIRFGQKLPFGMSDTGVAKCSAVAEPTSSLAYLLQVERYSIGLEEVHRLDAEKCALELQLYETKITELSQAQTWPNTSKGQRWLGRMETAIVAGLILGGYVAVDRSLR